MQDFFSKLLSKRESAALLIGFTTLIVVFLPSPLFEFALLTFTYLLGWELENLLGRRFFRYFPPLVFMFSLISPFLGLLTASLLALLYGYFEVLKRNYYSFETFSSFASAFLVSVYGGLFPYAAVVVKEHSEFLLLTTVLAVWAADTSAYYIGRYFGRKPFFKEISPKKTFEGFLGGLIGGFLTALITSSIFKISFPTLGWFFVVLASVFGDLFESFIKRSFGVKDSSKLLGSHGGDLDRFDALLFALLAVSAFL